jgi:ABC-type sulfate/molybdate transport systems ATPase subunit
VITEGLIAQLGLGCGDAGRAKFSAGTYKSDKADKNRKIGQISQHCQKFTHLHFTSQFANIFSVLILP